MTEGRVEAVNGRGIKIGGEWVNVSKFAPVELPPAGAQVRVETDPKGYIKSLEVLEDGESRRSAARCISPTRDRTITRLAVLKAAAQFMGQIGQAREQIKAEHVLAVADSWLAWVERP